MQTGSCIKNLKGKTSAAHSLQPVFTTLRDKIRLKVTDLNKCVCVHVYMHICVFVQGICTTELFI